MLERMLPRRLDNEYRGHKAAIWLFGFVVVMKSVQSLAIITAGRYTASGADGIPLATFAPTSAQAVLAIFAQQSLWRLTFCLVCFVILFRYRSGIPLMFAFLVLNYIASEVILHFVPLPSVGTPQGPAVNLVLFALMVAGLILAMWRRTAST